MFIYDSVQKKRLPFEPLKEGHVSIYVCGPTVYDDAHLGHARSAIAFDLLRRVFTALGFHVTFVKNFTDIDDKIIAKMKQNGASLEDITSFYIHRYKEDMHALHVNDADIEPKATECVEEIIAFIETLMRLDVGYVAHDGVYFDTAKDKKYLSLSGRMHEEDASLARVEHKEAKRDQKDFALWKFSKEPSEPSYPSPFGQGRPGWHIECSAMIEKYMASHEGAYQIDIHAGGADLLFPHHENEAAQTRCAGHHQELAHYWMHNGFVTINGEKMSKSLGNSFFLKDALKHYDGEVLRFYLLSTHYRANFNFSEEDLVMSKKRLDKLYRLKKRVIDSSATTTDEDFKSSMLEALSDDLNISKALAVLDGMISATNEALDLNPKDKALKATIHANLQWVETLLGIGMHSPLAYFQMGVDAEIKERIESMIEKRTEAKKAKDFALADAIRSQLEAMQVQLMDTANGTQWEKID
jgi:cysteinyl-tRNA synthetase